MNSFYYDFLQIPNRQVEFGTAPPGDLTPDLVKNLTVRGTTLHCVSK
jgi:hypothetical protein